MLIDAHQPEETRVVLLNGNKIEEFDYENNNFKQLKGNVYLARVTRVEPSLQAAFIEYGGNKQGFLAFSEIHPDYYRIPVEDRQDIEEVEEDAPSEDDNDGTSPDGNEPEELGGDEVETDSSVKRRRRTQHRYKIQEVIVRKQILLVQVVKEERGNKGAALTTYLSLAGRYCVLMPNSAKGGGVSRKITNVADRKRLKTVVADLDIPEGMAVIVRTAGSKRTKTEIKRDYAYLSRLWNEIREKTLNSEAPSLIHEEGSLVKRAIRDIYTNDVDEVLVEGEDSYKIAKTQMKLLIPSHAKRVTKYAENEHLFKKHQVEEQLETMHQSEVVLKSGGYLVINQTEALVAIDVNSGRATRERNVEEMAVKTNLEAAEEVGRQLKLRDLAGLIVIDFIDMEESKNQHAVERRLKDALRHDRARIQVGSISHFGLLEMSRQRLRISLVDSVSQTCPHCGGTGRLRSVNSSALHILRMIEEEAAKRPDQDITIFAHPEVALYILNQKRASLAALEARFGISIFIEADSQLNPSDHRIEGGAEEPAQKQQRAQTETPANTSEENEEDGNSKRRRRGRRGGRRRKKRNGEENQSEVIEAQDNAEQHAQTEAQAEPSSSSEEPAETQDADKQTKPKRSRRRRGASKQKSPLTENDNHNETTESAAQDVKPKQEKHAEEGSTEEEKPTQKAAKKVAKKAKAAKKKTAKKAAAKKKTAAKKAASAKKAKASPTENKTVDDTAPTPAPGGDESAAQNASRAPISSVEMDVVDVSNTQPTEKKKGWWSR